MKHLIIIFTLFQLNCFAGEGHHPPRPPKQYTQCPPPNHIPYQCWPPPCVPINNGITVLAAFALALGVIKLSVERKKTAGGQTNKN